jgi:hypothetical protein
VISKLCKLLVVPSLVKMNMTDLMLYDNYIDSVLKKVSNRRDPIAHTAPPPTFCASYGITWHDVYASKATQIRCR